MGSPLDTKLTRLFFYGIIFGLGSKKKGKKENVYSTINVIVFSHDPLF